MLKKVAKALDEMAKNEELMGGILAAAEEDIADGDQQYDQNGVRLNTIGEDGDEEGRYDTNKEASKRMYGNGGG
jgi:hypothetical protein